MKRWFWLALILPVAIWLVSMLPQGGPGSDFWTLRGNSIILSGIVAYSLMALITLLATRPMWLEDLLGGLDQSYRLHKWLGITAGVLVFVHWMMEIVPKWMAKAGWLTRPAKSGNAPERVFEFLRDPAKDIGEWLGYIAITLVLLALIKYIPYHWFRRLHKAFPLLFIAATFHAIVLLPDALWPTLSGIWVVLAALVGCLAGLAILFGLAQRGKHYTGSVQDIVRHADGVMEIHCRMDDDRLRFKPGQFAFVRFANTRDPHPFSIASSDTDPRTISFCVKVLGDDTSRLMQSLAIGSRMQLEGPYGRFTFANSDGAQVWVGGGVGVAPFISRLEHLAANPAVQRSDSDLHFFFCTPEQSPLNRRVADLCQRAGVHLHLIHQSRDGNLDLEKIRATTGGLHDSSLWFCGPFGLGDRLLRDWSACGLPETRFHREYFKMR